MMEQIPYACGRLGALAQDIRLRAGQLPALREAYRARFGGFAYYADQGGGLPLVRKE